jgi:hypothetical protein
MSCQKVKLLSQFKKQIIAFFDELIDQFPNEGELIIMRIFFKDQIPTAEVMEYFAAELLPLRKKLEDRDDAFFLENETLFTGLCENKVDYFKNLWPTLDKEDKNTIWAWFDLFVRLVLVYKNNYM